MALHTLSLNILSSQSCIHMLGNNRGTRRLGYRTLKRFSILLCKLNGVSVLAKPFDQNLKK